MPAGNKSFTPDNDGSGPAAAFLERAKVNGRPTKYDPKYCDEVIEVMRAGFSLTAFCGIIQVLPQTVANWRKTYPEFDEACQLAKTARLIHWEESSIKVGRGAGGPGAAPMVQFALRNLSADEYPDKQRVENTGVDGKPIEHSVTMVRRKIVRPGDGEEGE